MIRFKPGQIELPVFAIYQGICLRCIGFSLVRPLYPDPGTLLAVAVKSMLRTGDPSLNGIVHDVINLTDVLPIRFTQHVIALIVEQLRADIQYNQTIGRRDYCRQPDEFSGSMLFHKWGGAKK